MPDKPDAARKHRDFDISLTSGMIGFDFSNGYDFKEFTTIKLENVLDKAIIFYDRLLSELAQRPEHNKD